AKMNGLNPRKYIEWLLTEMPNAKDASDLNFLDSLMPWSPSIPTELHLKSKVATEATRMADAPIVDIDPETLNDDK
ncbi:MAG: transposase domain-containing protein, partial [Bacteroides sp.]